MKAEWMISEKYKKFRLALILQTAVLLLLALPLLRPLECLTAYTGEAQGTVSTAPLSLKAGVYRVKIHYELSADGSASAGVTNGNGLYRGMYGNDIPLTDWQKGMEFQFWQTSSSDAVQITVTENEGSTLTVSEIFVESTHQGTAVLLLFAACLFAAADGFWLFFLKKYRKEEKTLSVMLCMTGIIGLVSLPLLTDYLLNAMDLIFHLIRIEGVKEGLLSGQLPVRIQPNWLYGNGYAASVFYGDVFLVIPALLRMIGLPVQTAYKLFLLLINIATALIAYECFKRVFCDRAVGLLGSMLYSWSPYRIYDLYGRAALGETLALCFLPLILYGFYRIFTEDIHRPEYQRAWVAPALGFSCVIWSHTLSCEMMGGLAVLLCLLFIKRVFRRETFFVLCKMAACVLLLNVWFLVPFIDYYLTGDFVVKHIGGQTIQYRGVYPAHYLFTFFRNGTSSHTNEMGMQNTESLGIGFAVTVCLLLYLWILFTGKYKKKSEQSVFGARAAIAGVIVLVMSTNSFPWDYLQRRNGLFAALISSLQFPMRLLTVTTLCFTLVACLAVWLVRQGEKKTYANILLGTVAAIAFVTTQFLIGDTLYTKSPLWLYNPENIGATYIMGSEYLPAGTDVNRLSGSTYRTSQGVELTPMEEEAVFYGKRRLSSQFYAENTGDEKGYAEVPLLYYKGYQASVTDTGEKLSVKDGENHQVRIELPAGFSGSVRVSFVSPWYWRAAELVSLIAAAGLAVEACYRRGRRKCA